MFYVCFLVLYVLLSILCVLCFCIALCTVSPHVYNCFFSICIKVYWPWPLPTCGNRIAVNKYRITSYIISYIKTSARVTCADKWIGNKDVSLVTKSGPGGVIVNGGSRQHGEPRVWFQAEIQTACRYLLPPWPVSARTIHHSTSVMLSAETDEHMRYLSELSLREFFSVVNLRIILLFIYKATNALYEVVHMYIFRLLFFTSTCFFHFLTIFKVSHNRKTKSAIEITWNSR